MNTISIIENNCIAVSTKARYNSTNFNFIVWLYQHREAYPDHLHQRLYDQIDAVMMDEAVPDEKKKMKKIREIVVAGWLMKMIRGESSNMV